MSDLIVSPSRSFDHHRLGAFRVGLEALVQGDRIARSFAAGRLLANRGSGCALWRRSRITFSLCTRRGLHRQPRPRRHVIRSYATKSLRSLAFAQITRHNAAALSEIIGGGGG